MSSTQLFSGLFLAIHRMFDELLPSSQSSVPMSLGKLPLAMAYFVPYTFMAYLVRREGTYPLRLLVMPVTIAMAIRGTYGYTWEGADGQMYGCVQRLIALTVVSKTLDFGFARNGRFKIGEKELPRASSLFTFGQAPTPQPRHSSQATAKPDTRTTFLPPWLADAFEVSLIVRGIGWDTGRDTYVPKLRRPTERGPWLRATVGELLWTYLWLDLGGCMLKAFPGIRESRTATIFLPELPPLQRYALSTTIHTLSGFIIMGGVNILYDTCALLSVAFLGHAPASWPPIQDCPPCSCSLHELWSKRWHQLLRNTFLIYGGNPGALLAGNVGRVFGAFLASGLYHAIGMQTDHRVTLFFVLQAVGLLAEKMFRVVTGRRVGGVLGWVWTATFMLGFGQMLTDAFAVAGMAGGVIPPEQLSPVSYILSPVIRRWIVPVLQ